MTNDLPFEIVRLAVALLVIPPVLFYTRRVRRMPGRNWWFVSIAAIYASYVFAVLDNFVAPGLMQTLQPVCWAIAGVTGVVAVVQVRRYITEARST